jgi:hypothetical protein
MVHPKKKSGDPDYDDKVPMDEHLPKTVKDADGNDVAITETAGPVNADGSHAALDAESGDNRPAPGEVATESSTVQEYDASADAPKLGKSTRKS